jgi:ADP-heptose:LPS heptosyltransferase
VRLSALGDVLHALPVLSGLRALLPDARIDWAVEDRAAELLRDRSDLDAVRIFPRRALGAAVRGLPDPVALWRSARPFVRELRAAAYDVALDLQGNLKSGAVTRVSGAALRFGLAAPDAREGNRLFTQRRAAPPPEARHRVERNLALAGALLGRSVPYVPPGFPVSEADRRRAAGVLAAAGLPARGYVALHPGTSAFGAFKRWPAERFGAVARALTAAGRPVAVTHAPGEEALAARVLAASGPGPRSVAAPSLPALAEILRQAAFFAAADTGPLHLAALVGTPLVGLFGPKDPEVYGPYGLRADGTPGLLPVLTQEHVACRPCGLRRCADPLCMRMLAPERVCAAVLHALGGP